MLTEKQIAQLHDHPEIGWISALKAGAIRELVEAGALQLSLFDQQNLVEIQTALYPEERLVACFNPLLAEERKRKREELLRATERDLEATPSGAAQEKILRKEEIALKAPRQPQGTERLHHQRDSPQGGQGLFERLGIHFEQ